MEVLAAWLLGLAALYAHAALSPALELEPIFVNIPVIWVVWVTLRRDADWAFATVLLFGTAAGLLGGAGRGPFLIALCSVGMATIWLRHRLQLEGSLVAAGWAAVMTCLFDLVFLSLVSVSSQLPWAGGYLLRTTPLTALLTAAAAVLIAPVLSLLGRLSATRTRGLAPLRPR
jgi:hypothetical protein